MSGVRRYGRVSLATLAVGVLLGLVGSPALADTAKVAAATQVTVGSGHSSTHVLAGDINWRVAPADIYW